MTYRPRELSSVLTAAARAFPAVVLTGPRRAGKTTLLRHLFSTASYALLEDPAVVAAVRDDPRGFLEGVKTPAILDEIQNVPELLGYLRTRIDAAPRRRGQWFITGSQDFGLMRGVTESMAGRAAILHLLPLSIRESNKVSVERGGFPEVIARPRGALLWFQSYLQTYLERDVRQITRVRDLSTYRRFLSLVASRTGQLLNKSDLASALGLSVPAITEWLSILETTGQIVVVPPYFENFGKRLVKTPKVYFTDSGLACHLLGLETRAALERSTFLGPIFEGFVAAEIIKSQVNTGKRREIYFFRDQRGLEVDFVVPIGGDRLALLEVKASRTVLPQSAKGLLALAESVGMSRTQCAVVHAGLATSPAGSVLTPGVSALSVRATVEMLGAPSRGKLAGLAGQRR